MLVCIKLTNLIQYCSLEYYQHCLIQENILLTTVNNSFKKMEKEIILMVQSLVTG